MPAIMQTFAADAEEIPRVREFVAAFCRDQWQVPADDEAVSHLRLAISELFSNILLHARIHQSPSTIDVSVSVDSDRATVTLAYFGCAFAPGRAPEPDFSGQSESGFGLYLIQQTMDEMHLTTDPAGRCLIRIVKHRRQG